MNGKINDNVRCPGCEALNFIEIEKIQNFSVLRCLNCELEFSHPMISATREWYEKTYVLRHSAIDTRIRYYYKWTISSLPIRGRLLDVGCGEGVFVNYARKKGFDAYGIDFSKNAIELGKMWYKLNTLYNCTLAELKRNYKISNFDVITLFEVLEHLENPKEFLREIKTLLKKNGYIAVSVPFKERWPFREFNDYPPHHLTRWTQKSLRIFFQLNGFNIVKMEIDSGFRSYSIFLGYLIRSLVYKIFGIYNKGLKVPTKEIKFFTNPIIKYIFSTIRPRQIRDIILWPFAIVTYPFVFPWFKGYNLMLIAQLKELKKKEEKTQSFSFLPLLSK